MKTVEEVVSIRIDKLEPHPDNPRKPASFKKEKLKPLAAAMDANGVTPLIVRKMPGQAGLFQVLGGHRREATLEQSGETEAPCVIREMDDFAALRFVLADNAQHEDPDPFLEARAIDKLLKQDGATLQGVADGIGWSVRTVARRRELLNLCKTVLEERQREDSPVSRWPVTWLEAIVQLDPVVQESWWKNEQPASRARTLSDIEGTVQEYLRDLGKAPWDVDDAKLLPKAGACSACPKQTNNESGLFGTLKGEKPTAGATCRDAVCWKKKLDRHAAQKVAAVVEKDPEVVLLRGATSYSESGGDRLERASAKAPKGHEVLADYAWKPCAKDDKGAKKGVVISGPSAGKVQWFKKTQDAMAGPVARGPNLKQRLADEERRHGDRLARNLSEEAIKLLEAASVTPDDVDIFALAMVIGSEGDSWAELVENEKLARSAKPGERMAFLWPGVQRAAIQQFGQMWGATGEQQRWLAVFVARCMLDASEIEQWEKDADAAIPVSDELAALREEVGAKPAKKAKGAKKAKPTIDDVAGGGECVCGHRAAAHEDNAGPCHGPECEESDGDGCQEFGAKAT